MCNSDSLLLVSLSLSRHAAPSGGEHQPRAGARAAAAAEELEPANALDGDGSDDMRLTCESNKRQMSQHMRIAVMIDATSLSLSLPADKHKRMIKQAPCGHQRRRAAAAAAPQPTSIESSGIQSDAANDDSNDDDHRFCDGVMDVEVAQ